MDNEFINGDDCQNQPNLPEYVPTTQKAKKPLSAGRVIALALSFSLIGSILGTAGTVLVADVIGDAIFDFDDREDSDVLKGIRESTVINTHKIDTSKLMTPAQVYAANVNSTVGITTAVTTNFWGYQTTSAASGSGFILSEDGYILTNHHVIEDSSSITVALYDGTDYDAELIGYDASNDIAVLKVDADDLPPAILGNSDNLNVGDPVVAIGNPLGELTFSLTQGVISAMGRQVTLSGTAVRFYRPESTTVLSGRFVLCGAKAHKTSMQSVPSLSRIFASSIFSRKLRAAPSACFMVTSLIWIFLMVT